MLHSSADHMTMFYIPNEDCEGVVELDEIFRTDFLLYFEPVVEANISGNYTVVTPLT